MADCPPAGDDRSPHKALQEVVYATRISVSWCEHGNVHLEFRDAAGEVFAAGSLTAAGADNIADMLTRSADTARQAVAVPDPRRVN